ncbi:unnamed protein product [Lepeophtheirus salmonis]|uniref:(salmon louse) hypothetical protein n=1 Tax=Lepeophtheirus salmonis TaxID=72036 RepID=A0A817FDA2_LEPSM|nr:unnamed protein product [Lepeophtheirus salmonis]
MFILMLLFVTSSGNIISGQRISGVRSFEETNVRWPKNIVEYTFGTDYKNTSAHDMIRAAMDHIESQTCVRFVKKNRYSKQTTLLINGESQCSASGGYIEHQEDYLAAVLSLNVTTCMIGEDAAQSNFMKTSCGGTNINYTRESKPKEFPWNAYLVKSQGWKSLDCGGVLIKDNIFLFAASCFDGHSANQEYQIKVRTIFPDYHAARTQYLFVTNITIHPQYSSSTLVNDIAVVKTSFEPVLSDGVVPICLPTNSSHYYKERAATYTYVNNKTETERTMQVEKFGILKVVSNDGGFQFDANQIVSGPIVMKENGDCTIIGISSKLKRLDVFHVLTDYKLLTATFPNNKSTCTTIQARQVEFVLQFKTEIRNIKGEDKLLTDTLERMSAFMQRFRPSLGTLHRLCCHLIYPYLFQEDEDTYQAVASIEKHLINERPNKNKKLDNTTTDVSTDPSNSSSHNNIIIDSRTSSSTGSPAAPFWPYRDNRSCCISRTQSFIDSQKSNRIISNPDLNRPWNS